MVTPDRLDVDGDGGIPEAGAAVEHGSVDEGSGSVHSLDHLQAAAQGTLGLFADDGVMLVGFLLKEDDLGMEGLAERIRAAHNGPASSLALGLDSEAIITALTNAASALDDAEESAPTTGGTVMLSRAFTSPWAEIGGGSLPGRRTQTSLEAILPACYNVQAPPHAATRLASFTEEALFYMFYGMPRDRMQEMAARELTLNRGWRYHKELRLWLLPSSATPTASSMTAGISALRMSPLPTTPKEVKSPGMETAHDTASYVVFDPNTWSKIRRELPFIKEALLEDRFTASSPSSLASPLPK